MAPNATSLARRLGLSRALLFTTISAVVRPASAKILNISTLHDYNVGGSPYSHSNAYGGLKERIDLAGNEKGTDKRGCGQAVYGELPATSVVELFEGMDEPFTRRSVFYDCGSGRGLMAMWASIFGAGRAVGIEMATWRLRTGCVETAPAFKKLVRDAGADETIRPGNRIDLIDGNFLEQKVDDITHYYHCGTCFTQPFLVEIVKRLLDVSTRKQRRIVTMCLEHGFDEAKKDLSGEEASRITQKDKVVLKTPWGMQKMYYGTIEPPSSSLPPTGGHDNDRHEYNRAHSRSRANCSVVVGPGNKARLLVLPNTEIHRIYKEQKAKETL